MKVAVIVVYCREYIILSCGGGRVGGSVGGGRVGGGGDSGGSSSSGNGYGWL